jgi:filamentous hemagglutinin family protein
MPVPNGSVIEGGTRSGGNLFHSFERFSVPTGTAAIFNNPADVQNIFSRVTGSQASHIDGLLRTQGAANLFFLNPNGIVFGPNAQFFIGGAFVGTTASNIIFENGQSFGRDLPDFSLTVNVPVGLDFSGNSGSIQVNNVGHNISFTSLQAPLDRSAKTFGLQVAPGSSLALIADGIVFDGGVVTVNGGNLSIASLSRGRIALEVRGNSLLLRGDASNERSRITLDGQSLIDGVFFGGNNILVLGGEVSLTRSSLIGTQNFGARHDGSIVVDALSYRAREVLGDTRLLPGILSESLGGGKAADIQLRAALIELTDGGGIGSTAYSGGGTGAILIESSGSLALARAPLDGLTGIGNLNFGAGASGGITISAPVITLSELGSITSGTVNSPGANIRLESDSLSVTDGGLLFTTSFGGGKVGDIHLSAKNLTISGSTVNFDEGFLGIPILSTELGNVAAISTNSVGGESPPSVVRIEVAETLTIRDGGTLGSTSFGEWDASKITISARNVFISGSSPSGAPAQISSSTLGSGNASSIQLDASKIEILEEGRIHTATASSGNAGTIRIRADSIRIEGDSSLSSTSATISAAAEILDPTLAELLGVPSAIPTGQGGTIDISARTVTLNGSNSVRAGHFGNGLGGNILISGQTLKLDGDSVTTSTLQGDGGNIYIEGDTLVLNGGAITTASSLTGDGGNITLKTQAIGLFRGSRIEATAVNGDGGAISIETNFLFSDGSETISAISALGRDGTVNINTQPYTFSAIDMRYLGAPRPSEVALRACRRYGGQIARGGAGQTPRASNGAGRSFDDLIPLGQAVYMETSGDGKARFLNCFEYLERFPSEADAPEDGEG